MIRVVFKNLEKSELAKQAVAHRLKPLIEKFPDLRAGNIHVTLEMQNSPLQAGPDLFTVRSQINRGRYDGIRLEKSAPSLYAALNELVEHMLEKLNRFGDRMRVRERTQARKTVNFL